MSLVGWMMNHIHLLISYLISILLCSMSKMIHSVSAAWGQVSVTWPPTSPWRITCRGGGAVHHALTDQLMVGYVHRRPFVLYSCLVMLCSLQVLDERFAEPLPSSLTRPSPGPIWAGYKNLLWFSSIFLLEKKSFRFESRFVVEMMLLYMHLDAIRIPKSCSHFMVLSLRASC